MRPKEEKEMADFTRGPNPGRTTHQLGEDTTYRGSEIVGEPEIVRVNQPYATTSPSRALVVGLWVAQVVLAIAFAMAGYTKLVTPLAQLHQMMPAVPLGLARFIGAAEVLGAVGVILPAATRVWPILTAWAATGFATIMVLATVLHMSRGEFQMLPVTLGLLAVSAFVAWGRFTRARIAPRV